ncbi:cold shock domain-containing protein [Candidatus Parcubacteria bacterium]|nr:cold shock domain-containing protein [Candidatus Parcubacteria bacterium]
MFTDVRPVKLSEVKNITDFQEMKVKWFSKSRGYGFLTRGPNTPNIFLHAEVLMRSGVAWVAMRPDKSVCARFGQGPKGLMATEVRLV